MHLFWLMFMANVYDDKIVTFGTADTIESYIKTYNQTKDAN